MVEIINLCEKLSQKNYLMYFFRNSFLVILLFQKLDPASCLAAVQLVVQLPSKVVQMLFRVVQLPFRVICVPSARQSEGGTQITLDGLQVNNPG